MTSERQKHTIELLKEATDGVLRNSHVDHSTARDELKDRAKEAAYRLLSVRDRSTAELEDRLLSKGFDPLIVEETISRLTEVGLLNDRKFARSWVLQRTKYSARGKNILRQELRHKGINEEIISAVLEEIPVQLGVDAARTLVMKKASRLESTSIATWDAYQKEKRRLYNMLVRRGFDCELAAILADEALQVVRTNANDEN